MVGFQQLETLGLQLQEQMHQYNLQIFLDLLLSQPVRKMLSSNEGK